MFRFMFHDRPAAGKAEMRREDATCHADAMPTGNRTAVAPLRAGWPNVCWMSAFGAAPRPVTLRVAALLALFLMLRISSGSAASSGAWTVTAHAVVTEGAPSPDGHGFFGSYTWFTQPTINDSSEVLFGAWLTGTTGGGLTDESLVRSEPNGTLTTLIHEGDAVPSLTTATFGAFLTNTEWRYALSNSGRAAFYCGLRGTTKTPAIFSVAGPSFTGLLLHARVGDGAPDTPYLFTNVYPPVINNQAPADLAFYSNVWTGTYPPGNLYISSGGSTHLLCYSGEAMPGGGTLSRLFESDGPAIRPNAPECVGWARLFPTVDVVDRFKIGSMSQLARGSGGAAPGGLLYGAVYGAVYNILGNAAFRVNFSPAPSAGDGVVIVGDGSDDLACRTGWWLPDSSGKISGLNDPSLSAGNLAAFRVDLSSTPGGSLDNTGIVRADGTILIQVAREGKAPPEANGVFADFGTIVGINAQAQVLFTATLRGTSGGSADNRGLYLWDELHGIVKLLRLGDVIGGRTVVDFSTLTTRDYGGRRSLNDASTAVALVNLSGFPAGGSGVYTFRAEYPVGVEGAPRSPAASLEAGPSPFGSSGLAIRFATGGSSPVSVRVFDALGRRVRELYRGPGGATRLHWDGRDASGAGVASGAYFVRMEQAGISMARRVVRVR